MSRVDDIETIGEARDLAGIAIEMGARPGDIWGNSKRELATKIEGLEATSGKKAEDVHASLTGSKTPPPPPPSTDPTLIALLTQMNEQLKNMSTPTAPPTPPTNTISPSDLATFEGESFLDVSRALRIDHGIKTVGKKTENNDDVPEGHVVRVVQNGSDEATAYVSTGPKMITIPNGIVGVMKIGKAQYELSRVGFDDTKFTTVKEESDTEENIVTKIEPAPGTSFPAASPPPITITYSGGKDQPTEPIPQTQQRKGFLRHPKQLVTPDEGETPVEEEKAPWYLVPGRNIRRR